MSIHFRFYAFSIVIICLVSCTLIASTASETVLVASDTTKVTDVPDSEINKTAPHENEKTDSSKASEKFLATDTEGLKVEVKTYKIFKKDGFVEPYLLRAGHPDKESKNVKKIVIKGKIIPERHPLGHRKYFYRWVIEKTDGSRIPLKSNIILLQKVKNEDLLDGFVSVKGTWIISPSNKELKFFKAKTIRVIDELPNEKGEVEKKLNNPAQVTDDEENYSDSHQNNEADEEQNLSDEENDVNEIVKAK